MPDGQLINHDDLLVPCLKVVLFGWSWSFHLCQDVLCNAQADERQHDVAGQGRLVQSYDWWIPGLSRNRNFDYGWPGWWQVVSDTERRKSREEQEQSRTKPPRGAHSGAGGGVKD